MSIEIIDDTQSNWLIRNPDGRLEKVGKSPINRALIEYDLWDLLKEGNTIYQTENCDGRDVTLVSGADANEFTLRVNDIDGVHLGAHKKSTLVDRIVEGIEAPDETGVGDELVALYDEMREDMVRRDLMVPLSEQPPFAGPVEVTDDGWLIHDHLLLTWEREFHHPHRTAYDRNGDRVEETASETAYELNVRQPDIEHRDVTIDGRDYRLTDSEMEFLGKALWAITNAPDGV